MAEGSEAKGESRSVTRGLQGADPDRRVARTLEKRLIWSRILAPNRPRKCEAAVFYFERLISKLQCVFVIYHSKCGF